ncbi:MAG: hypothetical protein U9R39_00410, partial [Campylobacterota bacterium]|nr:hypothetical protein [Campylobacterota bacterium]
NDIKEVLEKVEKESVPSFYFPKYYESKKENFKEGEITKITIKLKDEEAYDEIKKELEEFKKVHFFFLNQLKNKSDKKFEIYVKINSEESILQSEDKDWDIISLQEKYKLLYQELKEEREKQSYKNIPDEPNIAIAFPPDNKEVDAKFYTYLPTKAECEFNVLIHADFALDNARVSIPDNQYNNKILNIAAKMLVNELLTNTKYHDYQNFAKFLMPKDKDDKFAKKVWTELIKDDTLTEILKKVYTEKKSFTSESYELVFEVIDKWSKEKTKRAWGDHYNEIYSKTLKYFCNEDIFIVPIDEQNKTFLPPKKENKKYEHNLFFKQKVEHDISLQYYNLLGGVNNLKLSSFEALGKDLYFHNKITRKFSTLEIIRALKEHESISIIKFIHQLLDNTKEELHQDVKKQLLELKLPTAKDYVKVAYSYINIDENISSLFNNDFAEVDKEQLKDIENIDEFLKKIGVANNKLPCNGNLPFKDECNFPESNLLKDFITNSLEFLDDEMTNQLKTLSWFYDERKEKLFTPEEIFLFKEHDNRKIESIAQEKKSGKYKELYLGLHIDEIEDTIDVNKLIKQLEKMKDKNIDSYHQNIYKKITTQLAKIYKEESSIDTVPLLVISMKNNEFKYINEERSRVVFLETKYKKYKEQIKENYEYIGYFDTNIAHSFIEKTIGIDIFNPNYIIEYKDENNKNINEPKEHNDLKEKLQEEFLPQFFALANEILGSSFEKSDAIKRWENLIIKYAHNVILTIKDKNKSIIVSSTEANDIDVLYIPIKDRQNKPTQIGEVAHDLSSPMENSNLRKFAQVFAEGIFRNQKLKSDFELYITGYLNKDKVLQDEILINKGIEDLNIEQMKNFIKENLLNDTQKSNILEKIKGIGVDINNFNEFKNFELYKSLECSFEDYINKFDDDYKNIIENFVLEYKQYFKDKIAKLIEKNKKKLQILSFKKSKNRESFYDKLKKVKSKNLNYFKIETDIFKLFDIEDIDNSCDSYIEAKIDFEFETDDIANEKFNITTKSNKIKSNDNPIVGSAKQSNENREKEINEQLKNQNRGLGQELKVSFKYTKQLFNIQGLKDDFIEQLKDDTFDYGIDNQKINNYIMGMDKIESKLDFAKKVINIASNKLDGLGYDLVVPIIEDNKIKEILKVELKSTKSKDGEIQVHFSQNEIKRIKYFIEQKDSSFRVWLNCEDNDITVPVCDAVKQLPEQLLFYFEDYILSLGINK